MSSRFRNSAMVLVAMVLVAGCDREQRSMTHQPKPETMSYVASGDPRSKEYENNAFQMAQGQRLFMWMNCVGCHAHGGGGMGPPLMDNKWRYGGRMEDIVYTILNGRPNGMPSFRDRLNEQQVWEIVAYVRSLSGLTPKGARSGRDDHMMMKPAEQQTPNAKPKQATRVTSPPPPAP